MIYALTILVAVVSGWYDAWCIKRNLPINHLEGWLARAISVGLVVLVDFAIGDYPGWQMLPKAIGCAFLFSAVFRLTLNLWRGKDWRYVSPSSWYDWQFLKRTWFTMDGHVTTQEHAIVYHGKVYSGGPNYKLSVHRAGLIAYSFELVVFGLVAWLV